MMLMQDHPSFSRCFCSMKKEEEQEARSRESLSTCVLKDLAGEVEPGSSPRTRFIGKTQETGKVTSSTVRSQHLSVWRGERRVPVGWVGMTGPKISLLSTSTFLPWPM